MLSAQINYIFRVKLLSGVTPRACSNNSNNDVVDYRSAQSEVLLACSLMQNACWPL
jgi:hypothetical protein